MATRPLNRNYLNFNALSMKDAITKRLAEDPKFTDMNLEDSNLTILIDIFAQTFQTLMYYNNTAASETLFSDSAIYENMNRIVKFIGYNPQAYLPAAVAVSVTGFSDNDKPFQKILPKYSRVTTSGITTSSNVYYSTIEDTYIYNTADAYSPNATNTVVLYEGYWKLYERTFTSSGSPSEVFILTNLVSDRDQEKYQSLTNIDAFIKRYNNDGSYTWLKFRADTDNLFIRQNNTTLSAYDRVFQARINEYKQVEITFGDGVNGELLKSGDEIYFVYLKSAGPDAAVGANVLDDLTFSYGIAGLDSTIFDEIFETNTDTWLTDLELSNITVSNSEGSSVEQYEETVDDIRANAPKWFRRMGKLTTKDDFRNFILSNYKYDIIDAYIFNNYSYLTEFFGWLYEWQKQTGITYINKQLKNKYDYEFADASDSNNVYACIKFKSNVSITKRSIERAINAIKPLTSEIVFINPVTVKFAPLAYDVTLAKSRYDLGNYDPNFENYVEVLVNDTSLVSPESVKTKVVNIIKNYFVADNQKLGAVVDLREIYNQIMSIDGVSRVRTVFIDSTGAEATVKINGLRMAYWTPTIISGADFNSTTGVVHIENFQFAELNDTEIANRIKVVVDSISPLPNIEF